MKTPREITVETAGERHTFVMCVPTFLTMEQLNNHAANIRREAKLYGDEPVQIRVSANGSFLILTGFQAL